jgi:hypothetical protein
MLYPVLGIRKRKTASETAEGRKLKTKDQRLETNAESRKPKAESL